MIAIPLALSIPPGADRENWRAAIERELEAMCDRQQLLLEVLNTLDGDPDLEPSEDDEPSIGSTAQYGKCGKGDDLELDDSDEEPWLGWTSTESARGRYAVSTIPDGEQDDSDREPSLAAPESGFPWTSPFGFIVLRPEWMTQEEFDRARAAARREYRDGGGQQLTWAAGARQDFEDEHDHREPDCDDEPDLDGEPDCDDERDYR